MLAFRIENPMDENVAHKSSLILAAPSRPREPTARYFVRTGVFVRGGCSFRWMRLDLVLEKRWAREDS